MLFRKNEMLDLRDLQKRGILRVPKQIPSSEPDLRTDAEGFVDFSQPPSQSPSPLSSLPSSANSFQSSSPNFFNFLDSPSSSATASVSASSSSSSLASSVSVSTDAYSKREVDIKLESLDNKLFQFEQKLDRIAQRLGI